MLRDTQKLIKELDYNFKSLAGDFNFYEFSKQGPSGKLRLDDFQKLELSKGKDKKIRWFIIKTSKDFEEDLVAIYDRFKKYNGAIDRLVAKGEVKTESDIEKLNAEREQLKFAVLKIKDELANLQRKFTRER